MTVFGTVVILSKVVFLCPFPYSKHSFEGLYFFAVKMVHF